MAEQARKKKVVIIGGGAGGLATAFGLTDQPGWQERWDITVYQVGWRLGGKGHTGRNAAYANRVQEHGEHMWSGFYQNSFRMIQTCYREMVNDGLRAADSKLATWEQGFMPDSYASFGEYLNEKWTLWGVDLTPPTRIDKLPGNGGKLPSPFEMILLLLPFGIQMVLTAHDWQSKVEKDAEHKSHRHVLRFLEKLGGAVQGPALKICAHQLQKLRDHLEKLEKDASKHLPEHHKIALDLLGLARIPLHAALKFAIMFDLVDLVRLLAVVDIGMSWTAGMLADGVLTGGFDVIDDQDYREWLVKHGALRESTEISGLVRGSYEYLFSEVKGDPKQPRLAAGAGLRMLLRLITASDGAAWWRMVAGFGDTVFTPLYLALAGRGVKFKFFHRASKLELSKDGKRVEKIVFVRQVDLKEGESPKTLPYVPRKLDIDYQPFIGSNELPCWPDRPLYDQIVQGKELQEGDELPGGGYNLESAWTAWKKDSGGGVGTLTLCAREVADPSGCDGVFDLVVLATSLEPVRYFCEWPEGSTMKRLVDNVQTVQTFGLQLWMKPTLEQLGVSRKLPLLTAFAKPVPSYADMTDVLAWEEWKNPVPQSLAYFCGSFPDAEKIPPPYVPDPAFPKSQQERLAAMSKEWIDQYLPILWPLSGTPGSFDWQLLDVVDGSDQEKWEAQFWVANIDPEQRYVLSLPGTTDDRPKAGDSGVDNLYLSGDWVRNGLNCGAVESAVLGGLQASRAIGGWPEKIWGETDFQDWEHFPPRAEKSRPLGQIFDQFQITEQIPPPYDFKDFWSQVYVLQADPAKLDQVCRKGLEVGPLEHLSFRNVLPAVFVQVNNYHRFQAVQQPFHDMGWMRAHELSISLLVAQGKTLGGRFWPQMLRFFTPFIFIDNPWSEVTGRFIFGFPKQLSTLDIPEDITDPTGTSLATMVFPRCSPDTELVHKQVLEIVNPTPAEHKPRSYANHGELMQDIFDRVGLGPDPDPDLSAAVVELMIDSALRAQIPMITLKQVRNAVFADKADYLGVVGSVMQVTGSFEAGELPDCHAVRLWNYDSLPIAELLGLGEVPALGEYHDYKPLFGRGFWMKLDSRYGAPEYLYDPLAGGPLR